MAEILPCSRRVNNKTFSTADVPGHIADHIGIVQGKAQTLSILFGHLFVYNRQRPVNNAFHPLFCLLMLVEYRHQCGGPAVIPVDEILPLFVF